MTSGLVYLVLLLWQGRSGWELDALCCWPPPLSGCWWRIRYSGSHWGWWPRPWRSGCAIAPTMLAHIDQSTSQNGPRQLLLLCWVLVAVQYVVHGRYRTSWGWDDPWLVRPDVVDGFRPSQVVSFCGPGSGQGLADPITRQPPSPCWCSPLSALLLGRAFCAWFCPLGLVGSGCTACARACCRGVGPPRWLDAVLRGQKFLVLAFLLFIIAGGTRRRPARLPPAPTIRRRT